eukprot:9436987-Pyramimonas_sp.AAC.1
MYRHIRELGLHIHGDDARGNEQITAVDFRKHMLRTAGTPNDELADALAGLSQSPVAEVLGAPPGDAELAARLRAMRDAAPGKDEVTA